MRETYTIHSTLAFIEICVTSVACM
jgi:hypothetical protein